MAPTPDEEFDLLLGTHLAEQLEPQVGKSVTAFRASLAPRWRIGWWIASASAIAAGIVLAFVLFRHPQRERTIGPIATNDAPKEVPSAIVQSARWSRLEDEGLTLVANEPARQLRRQVVDEVGWYDPRRRATVKTTVPRQQVILIGLKTD